MVIEDYELFDMDIDYWRFELNIDLPISLSWYLESMNILVVAIGGRSAIYKRHKTIWLGVFLKIGRLGEPMPYNVGQKIQISSTTLWWISQMII